MREDTFLFEYLISINCYICLIGHASLANTNIVVWHSQTFTETLCGKGSGVKPIIPIYTRWQHSCMINEIIVSISHDQLRSEDNDSIKIIVVY